MTHGTGNLTPALTYLLRILAIDSTSAWALIPFLAVSCIPVPCPDISRQNSVPCDIAVTRAGFSGAGPLDLFFFNTDELARLDAYQRFEIGNEGIVHGTSRTGMRKVVGIANLEEDRYTWSDINSLKSLEGLKSFLDEDDPARPIMSGTTSINAGTSSMYSLDLQPLMSEVILRSLRCDFSSRSYRNETLKDIKVYLTNVCCACAILPNTGSHSSEYMNIGRADSTSLSSLSHPEYIYSHPGFEAGSAQIRPDLHFYCYPNDEKEETLGTPFTRLVIEGTIGGKRYYYPINVNRRSGSSGVGRNTVYILDVVLTRRGTTDPDTAVDSGMAEICMQVEKWNEKNAQYVTY